MGTELNKPNSPSSLPAAVQAPNEDLGSGTLTPHVEAEVLRQATPRPWKVLYAASRPPKIVQEGKPGFVAQLGFPNTGNRDANAELIVAAVNALPSADVRPAEQPDEEMKIMSKNTDATLTKSHEQTGHTPGPWHVENRCHVYAERENRKPVIAICDNTHGLGDARLHDEANARLIAAAPELLEALKQVHAILSQPVAFSDESANDQKSLEILRSDCFAARQAIDAAIVKSLPVASPDKE